MNAQLRWISSALPQRWAFKKDISPHLRHMARKVQFRFECVWLVRNHEDCVLFANGMWAHTYDFYLRTPGHVIGLRDLSTADQYDWAHEWRAAMHLRIHENIGLPIQADL